MLALQQAALQRGSLTLFSNANLQIYPGEHWGVIGNNGCGKSSFFQLLLGQLSLDSGNLQLPKDWRLAHMAQEVPLGEQSALDYVIDGHSEYRRLQAALQQAEQADDHSALADLHLDMENIDAYRIEQHAASLLHGLGFAADQQRLAISAFSGGWRIRLNLAQALMRPAELLLLDEPTNHLDLDAIVWLEKWLRNYPGTLLLISHDKAFLDAVVDHVAHFERQQITSYTGNYSSFEIQRAAKLAEQQATYQQQQQRVAEIEEFVRRFRAKASKARQAQSRLKSLQRMELTAPAQIDSPFSFRFPAAARMSDPMLRLDDADLGYGQTAILREVHLNIRAGARIGLLGRNGAGKSTLLKSLTAQQPLLKGELIAGEKIQLVYFAQDLLNNLDYAASPITHLQRLTPKVSEQRIRDFLGGFDFRGERAESVVKHFSGGEKTRLALAMCVWRAPNLLVLDEPTNHLDINMREALLLALQDYQGAMLLVSHDRYLLENSVDELYLVADGQVEPFDGDLLDYQQWLSKRNSPASAVNSGEKPLDKKAKRQQQAALRQRLTPLKQQLQKAEQQLQASQKQLAAVQLELADPSYYAPENKQKLQTQLSRQTELSQQTDRFEHQWLELSMELDTLSEQLTASDN